VKRGRHQSSCKDGKKSIKKIESLPGVHGVIIGFSIGGKSIGQGKSAGDVKLQRIVEGGIKGVLQTSKGVQEIFVRVDVGKEIEMKSLIEKELK